MDSTCFYSLKEVLQNELWNPVTKTRAGVLFSEAPARPSNYSPPTTRLCDWFRRVSTISVTFSHASLISVESTNSFNLTNPIQNQWRIQDIPRRRAPTPKVGALTYCCANFFRKTSEKIDRIWTDGVPVASLGSANEIGKT